MILLPIASCLALSTACSPGSDGSRGTDSSVTRAELCGNGLDDDGDGHIDCADRDCGTDPSCTVGAVHVATDGQDGGGCGDPGNPCRTIQHGIGRAAPGETVWVHAGTYYESWLWMRTDVRVASADGPLAAHIHSGGESAVRFSGVARAEMDGFEISGDHDQGPLGDGLVRIDGGATDVILRNCVVHGAPSDCDVIKVTDTDGLLLENLVVYDPARRVAPNSCAVEYQENVDLFGHPDGPPRVRNVTLRGSWLFHDASGGDYLVYAKRNTENVVYEDNVFGPSAGGGCGNGAVALGNSEDSAGGYHVEHAIVRNNLFSGLKGDAALQIMNAADVWVYGNVFYRNSGPDLRSVIELRGNQIPLGELNVLDNVFWGNQPAMAGAALYWLRDAAPTPFFHDRNLYGGNVTASDVDYASEPQSLYDLDPLFTSPAVPGAAGISLDRIELLRQRFRLRAGSPAVDAGLDAVTRAGHPNWAPGETDLRRDAFGNERPAQDRWDLGLHEQTP